MTTIVYRDRIMASDSLLSDGDGNGWATCSKIKKVKGWLIGAAGDFDATEAFMAKFDPTSIEENRYIPLYPQAGTKDEDFESIVVSPKGKIYLVSTTGIFGTVKSYGYIAIGSGSYVALGAMFAGADARTAIRAATRHSAGTGGRIKILRLSNTGKVKVK